MNTTYPFLENTNQITEEYIKLTYDTSRKRITLGGYRLANLVISIYEKFGKTHETYDSRELWDKMKSWGIKQQ